MKLTTRQITTTAVLLAICIVSQFFKNLSVYITGPIINCCLILVTLEAGLACGIILSVITPITAFLISGMPIVAAIPQIEPCIILGNIILVFFVYLLSKKKTGNVGIVLGMVIGSILKAAFMGIAISLFLIPSFLPAASPLFQKMHIFQIMFSMAQLLTALIGSIYAFIILIPLHKLFK